MVVLLHLNGPPGVGKSSLARRFADEHHGALNLDIDRLVPLIGGGGRDFFGALVTARRLAVGMAETHLRAGHDVVLPQMVNDVAEARRFETSAAEASARYVEVALTAASSVHIRRFHERGVDSDIDLHVADAVEGKGGDVFLERMHRQLEDYLEQRPDARRIETDDLSPQRAYAAVLRALSEAPGVGDRDAQNGDQA